MPGFERVVIFDQRLYGRPDGMVFRWCAKITTVFGNHARHYAPERSGTLRAGINTETNRLGPRQVEGVIESTAPHTMWVIDGTTGPIRTRLGQVNPRGRANPITGKREPGYWLHLPEGGPGIQSNSLYRGQQFGEKILFEVAGQRGNNFLIKAWAATARNHSAIRGVHSPF